MADAPSDAVVLVSGGLDSATALAIALSEGHRCHAVTFHYGQRHGHEVAAASRVAGALGVEDHRVVPLWLGQLRGSALTDEQIAVPHGRTVEQMQSGIPVTYVPARNTIFLAYALAIAEITESDFIYVGVNSVDYSGYPDCRPQYVEAFGRLARLATRRAVECRPPQLLAPLQHLNKAEIIRRGMELGLDYGLTLSCYDPDREGRACGSCDACSLRRRGFIDAAVEDPTAYMPGAAFSS